MGAVTGKPVRCSLHIQFASETDAERVHRSVELDNEGYVESKLDGATMSALIEAESLKSLLHTLDDFLACVGVADRIVARKD